MEFAASLPARTRPAGPARSGSCKQAYRGRIPDAILDGAKKGFALPLDHWFRDELRDYTRDVLLDPRSLDRGYTRGTRSTPSSTRTRAAAATARARSGPC